MQHFSHSSKTRHPSLLAASQMPRNLHSSSGKPGTSENAAIRSPLVSNAVKKYRPANNDQLEKEFNRKHMVDEKRRRNKTMVMSPAHVQSPKAHPSTTIKSPIGSKGALFVQQGISSTSIHASRLASLPVSPSSMRISSGTNNDSGSLTITKNVSVEQMSKHFEEWMKIATDNKINAKNSWSLALIDYFSELTLLKEGDGINFQKASCTLDGCVKIYSSRVDSIADETDKLMNGLMDEKQLEVGTVNEPEDEDSEQVQSVGKEKKKTPSSTVLVNTLESNPEALNLKRFETEAPPSVVPIFKKISTLFDENCSRSFLLSTVPINSNGELSFSQSNSNEHSVFALGQSSFNFSDLNLSFSIFTHLKDKQTVSSVKSLLTDESSVDIDSVTRLVENINQTTTDLASIYQSIRSAHSHMDDLPDEQVAMEDTDEFAHSVESDHDDNFGGFDEAAFEDEPMNQSNEPMEEENTNTNNGSNISVQNPSLSSSMQELTLDEGNLNFDESIAQGNWAGPQHWKIKRQLAAFSSSSGQPKVKRQIKDENQLKRIQLDFTNESPIDIDKLFSKPSTMSTITNSLSFIQEKCSRRNLLPEDFKFNSANLLSLFTKPTVNIGRNIKIIRVQQKDTELEDEVPDTNHEIWQYSLPTNEEFNESVNLPEEQFGGDDNFGICSSDNEDNPVEPSTQCNDSFVFVPQIKPQKNIDIKKLKEIVLAILQSTSSLTFSELFQKVSDSNQIANLTHPYCFICLLHIANEYGYYLYNDESSLQIQSPPKQ